MKNELKLKHEYIIEDNSFFCSVIRITILELTSTSVLYKNNDTGETVREKLDTFYIKKSILEDLGKKDSYIMNQ